MIASLILFVAAAAFDPGGLTFDFPTISARLRAAPPVREPVELRIAAHGLLDERYAVSEGQCSLIEVYWRKIAAKDRFDADGFMFSFTFPAGIRYVAGEDLPFDNRLVVLVDGAERTVLRLPYNTQPPKPIACEIELSAGKHRITFVPIGLFNVYGIEVRPRKEGE